jgi:TonB-dependent starch-binding outer membrane protein SusC
MRKFLFLAFLSSLLTLCQPLTIKGKIMNEQMEPVAGAAILHKPFAGHRPSAASSRPSTADGRQSTAVNQQTSDAEGEFFLSGVRFNDTLIVTAAGYEPYTEVFDYTVRDRITVILKRNR